jgi:hypothetical protein
MPTLSEFLGAERGDDGAWRYEIPQELYGAFGGAFGGLVAAAALHAARSVTPGRRPVSLDCRFLRQLPAGTTTVTPSVVRAGRTLTAVDVDVTGSDGRLSSTASIGFADQEALADRTLERSGGTAVPRYDDADPWSGPVPADVPMIRTLEPRLARMGPAIASILRAPWSEPGTTPELACLAGDLCVGPPVASALADDWTPHPNPDVSLRFTTGEAGDEVAGLGILVRMAAGIATTAIEVRSGSELLAVGVSCSLLLAS